MFSTTYNARAILIIIHLSILLFGDIVFFKPILKSRIIRHARFILAFFTWTPKLKLTWLIF